MAEIINDYRTLLLHIPQQNIDASPEDYWEQGHVLMRECLAAAQALMGSNYTPAIVFGQASNEEAEKVQLQRYVLTYVLVTLRDIDLTDLNRVILDGSARRFQAHRIYLRIAAARRWVLHRTRILHGQRPTAQHSVQLRAIDGTFQQVGLLLGSYMLIYTYIAMIRTNSIVPGIRTNNRPVHRC